MQIPDNCLFCVYGVGAIIERVINEERFVLIQNRIRNGKQFGLIEVPCGKVKAMDKAVDVIKQRVMEETGLRITNINGIKENRTIERNVQNCQPFYSCQSIERDFPVVINFFICSAEGIPKEHTEAADNIRWISISELSGMLINEEEKFFPIVVGALKEYVRDLEERERKKWNL